ncbi:hypothetical protein vBRpoSV10_91 [Ruegeria phage vB_RpoS-V10]|nr:hypothetical protein vBRpoSV10_91 [Ruegeria phage vB_RpoS-V10]
MTYHTPYDFKNMSLPALKAALDAPTGDYFARSISEEVMRRLEEIENVMPTEEDAFTRAIVAKNRLLIERVESLLSRVAALEARP